MAKASLSLLLLTLLTSLHGLLLVLSLDQDFSYEKFVYDSAEAPLRQRRVDYIIVGGGTSGCPLAATLSQGASVLVLERGGSPERIPNVLSADDIPNLFTQEDNGRTAAERFRSEDGVDHLRGRVLGGTSMINGGQYSRTDNQFIKLLGIKWDNQEVEKAYKWVEDSLVSRPNTPAIGWQAAVRDSLLQSRFTPNNLYTLDHRVGTKLTGSTCDNTGRRHGAAELLKKRRQEFLRVVVNATVESIIFSSVATTPTAIGVRYLDSAGRSQTAFVTQRTGEVILSAGALGSPQLLLLSGIGSATYLKSLNIPVQLDLPDVGQSMADNPRNNIHFVVPFPLAASLPRFVGITDHYFIEGVSTRLSLSPVPFPFSLIQNGLSTDASVATISLSIPRPVSRGTLRLDSPTDVRVSPLVRFNYYSNPTDLLRCVNATQRIREMLRSPSLHRFRFTNLRGQREFLFLGPDPRQLSDDASTREFCQSTVTTSWNYHGGCVVGRVVDADFRVRGTSSLRVIDSSTLPSTPGTNPQATLMMLGRYVGLKMLRERGVQDSVEGHEAY